MKRRNFLQAMLAAGIAPAVVKAESLMRIKELPSGLIVPEDQITVEDIREVIAELNANTVFPGAGRDAYWGSCHPKTAGMMAEFGRSAGETMAKLFVEVYGA